MEFGQQADKAFEVWVSLFARWSILLFSSIFMHDVGPWHFSKRSWYLSRVYEEPCKGGCYRSNVCKFENDNSSFVQDPGLKVCALCILILSAKWLGW